MARRTDHDLSSVFINCPFTRDFRPLHEAMIFAVLACHFRPRSALEAGNSGDTRLDKIIRLIKESKYSVHDLSAVGLDVESGLPRFNMPFELGIAVGLKKATRMYASHSLLVLEHEKNSYQKYLSDMSGQDLQAHGRETSRLIPLLRNWLRTESPRTDIPGGARISAEFVKFQDSLPTMCLDADLDRDALPFVDLVGLAQTWLLETRSTPTERSTGSSSGGSGTTVRRTALGRRQQTPREH
jgi:hypothetical protein